MSAKQRLKLRKDLEKFHGTVKGWSRQKLTDGTWFAEFVERTLASYTDTKSPEELRAALGEDDPDELANDVVTTAIHRAIAATDAYRETLTSTEIGRLKDKKCGGAAVKLTGDSVALIAEVLYVTKLYIDLMFDLAAVRERVLSAGSIDLVTEVFGRALGSLDVEKAKAEGSFAYTVGAGIFGRAIAQTVGKKVGDALRKGFYCYLGKAIAQEMGNVVGDLKEWKAAAPETGPMLTVDPTAVEDALGFQSR